MLYKNDLYTLKKRILSIKWFYTRIYPPYPQLFDRVDYFFMETEGTYVLLISSKWEQLVAME